MNSSADLYLGAFLIVCGFGISLLNLRRVIKEVNSILPAVLISENMLLMCVGIAFISRSVSNINPINTEMHDIKDRLDDMNVKEETECNFISVLKSYGPFIISLVNSFLSLIIDNYMHYTMLADAHNEDEGNTVQEFHQRSQSSDLNIVSKLLAFGQKYFPYIAIVLQWIVPFLIALSMYPMEVKEARFKIDDAISNSDACISMLESTNESCFTTNFDINNTLELRQILPTDYIEAHEYLMNNDNTTREINSVISNVYQIIANMKNGTTDMNVTSPVLWRKPRANVNCMKVCYLQNKSLLLYMFIVALISYFIPITISTVILTKIHTMDLKRPGMKTYVSRELLYNILFWTPIMFDTFLSLLMCSYSMNGMRTSILNIIANVYQAVKNFMNTKYFQNNSVKPI